jgi:hypothetical protein
MKKGLHRCKPLILMRRPASEFELRCADVSLALRHCLMSRQVLEPVKYADSPAQIKSPTIAESCATLG